MRKSVTAVLASIILVGGGAASRAIIKTMRAVLAGCRRSTWDSGEARIPMLSGMRVRLRGRNGRDQGIRTAKEMGEVVMRTMETTSVKVTTTAASIKATAMAASIKAIKARIMAGTDLPCGRN